MLSAPIFNQFRFYLNKTFISARVKEIFKPGFETLNYGLFNDITDYLNSTITKVVWPGLTDDSTTVQWGVNKDTRVNRSRTNKGGKSPEELVDKSLTINFSCKESYFNWMVLYCNFLDHLKYQKAGEKVHLPDCTIHIMDDNGSVLMAIIFTEVVFKDLERIEFYVQDASILNREFKLELSYNNFDMQFFADNDKREKNEDIIV